LTNGAGCAEEWRLGSMQGLRMDGRAERGLQSVQSVFIPKITVYTQLVKQIHNPKKMAL
jgi:hypothetical protein